MRIHWLLALVLVASSASAQLVGECPPGQIAISKDGVTKGCGPLNFLGTDFECTATPLGITCQLENLRARPGIDCTDTSDSTLGLNTALAANVGRTTYIPSGCRLGLSPRLDNTLCTGAGAPLPCCTGASAGSCYKAVDVPPHTIIFCEDNTAGFVPVGQRCVGGTYPGAACASSAECLGGGTCSYDFGAAVFAASGSPSTYEIFRDTAAGTDIQIYNCSVWVAQADPYQRCTGGTNDGKPCRQECTGGSLPGFKCESNAQCIGGGSCLRLADCTTPGGVCTGAPHSAVGPGKINVFDFTRTTAILMRWVKVRDHFLGDATLSTSFAPIITDSDLAAEVNDCTVPPGYSPAADNRCNGPNAGTCCYGAQNWSTTNVQPTTAVTRGVSAAGLSGTRLANLRARGSSFAFENSDAGSVDFDTCTAVPTSSAGPGTAGGGITVLGASTVSKPTLSYLASGTTGITAAADCKVTDGIIAGAFTTGILANGSGVRIAHMTMRNVTSKGIDIAGPNVTVENNYVEGSGASAIGINVNGGNAQVGNNQVVSNPIDSMGYGIVVQNGGANANISGNYVHKVATAAFNLPGTAFVAQIENNTADLSNAIPTAALHPIHVLNDGANNQTNVLGNIFRHGWRGFATGTRTHGLTNTLVANNRFIGLSGAPIAAGGAGLMVQNNYLNLSGDVLSAGTYLTCDASCTTRGAVCIQDSDCTGCNAAVHACLPEPVNGFVGSPTAVQGEAHNTWIGNIMFNGYTVPLKQCTVAGPIGQVCEVASCAGDATCSGSPILRCQSGADGPPAGQGSLGKFCCQTAVGATCAVRDPLVHLRVLDYGSVQGYPVFSLVGNTFFGGGSDVIDVDMQSSAALGNLNMRWWNMSGNTHLAGSATNTIAYRFPTSFNSITEMTMSGNSFAGYGADVTGWQGTFGNFSYVPKTIALASDMATNSNAFVDIIGNSGAPKLQVALDANRAYFFTCELTFQSSIATTGIGFAMTGPAAPTMFTYVARIPTAAVSGGAGTDNFYEQEGNGNDATNSTSIGVGTALVNYMANVRGNIVTTAAGNLTARVKAENANFVTVMKGSNCLVFQVPGG